MLKGGNYLVLGDSTTKFNPDGSAPRPYPLLIQDAISQTFKPIHVIHKGVPGSDTTHHVNGLKYFTNFSNLDLVTIGLGTNDCGKNSNTTTQYQANLQKIINRIRYKNPNVPIILCTPSTEGTTNVFSGNPPDSNFTPYRSMCDTVASGYTNVFVCHFETAWTVAQSGAYTIDGTHPNDAGHLALKNLLWTIVQPHLVLS